MQAGLPGVSRQQAIVSQAQGGFWGYAARQARRFFPFLHGKAALSFSHPHPPYHPSPARSHARLQRESPARNLAVICVAGMKALQLPWVESIFPVPGAWLQWCKWQRIFLSLSLSLFLSLSLSFSLSLFLSLYVD